MHVVLIALLILAGLLLIGGALWADEARREYEEQHQQYLLSLPPAKHIYEGPCPLCYRMIRIAEVDTQPPEGV